MITAFYAALFGIGLIWLSLRIISVRRSEKISLGDGNSETLQRRVRAHGNYVEFVPLGLLLIYFVEIACILPVLTHAVALALLLGRSLHAYALGGPRMHFKFRVAGTVLTFTSIAISSAALIVATARTMLG
jgi:uncharacterized protein